VAAGGAAVGRAEDRCATAGLATCAGRATCAVGTTRGVGAAGFWDCGTGFAAGRSVVTLISGKFGEAGEDRGAGAGCGAGEDSGAGSSAGCASREAHRWRLAANAAAPTQGRKDMSWTPQQKRTSADPGRAGSRVLRWCPRSMGAGNKRLRNECVVNRHHNGLRRPDDAQRRPHRGRRKYDRASGAAALDARCRRAIPVGVGWSFRAAGVANDVEGIDDCIGGCARDEETRDQRGEDDRQRRCQRNDTPWREVLKVRAQNITPLGL
jgi:hypothetical protein